MRYIVVALLVIVIIGSGCISQQEKSQEIVHEHADFKVYLYGEQYNFSQEKHMSGNGTHLSEDVHLHDMDGEVMHKHANGVTLGTFFTSLKMIFNSTCFVLDNSTSYCNDGDKQIKLYVNSIKTLEYEKYEFKDLDKILITYGDESGIKNQLDSITGRACIYSEKCPEKGKPPDESSCAGQTVCKA